MITIPYDNFFLLWSFECLSRECNLHVDNSTLVSALLLMDGRLDLL